MKMKMIMTSELRSRWIWNLGQEIQLLVAANWPGNVVGKILEAVTNFSAPTFLKTSFTITDGKRFLRSPSPNKLNMFWKLHPTRKRGFERKNVLRKKGEKIEIKNKLLQTVPIMSWQEPSMQLLVL